MVLDVVQFRLELREAGDELQFRPAAVAEQEGDELLGDAAVARRRRGGAAGVRRSKGGMMTGRKQCRGGETENGR